jgi:hypothetical protein
LLLRKQSPKELRLLVKGCDALFQIALLDPLMLAQLHVFDGRLQM